MRLIPPDCSQEEVVVQLAHSLSAFQLTADKIFQKAALRADKCRQRLEQLGKRMEVLEMKMEVVEKLPDVPVLNCASTYPEVGTPGLYEPVFEQFGHSAAFTRQHVFSSLTANEPAKRRDQNSLNEVIGRRMNLSPQFFGKDLQRSEKKILDVSRVGKLNAVAASSSSEADLDHLLGLLTCRHQAEKAKGVQCTNSAQIDFSESLLDLCPPITSGQKPLAFVLGMDHQDDPFAYEPAELEELIDFDLPENLPGIDLKSVSFVSERSEERLFPFTEKDSDRRMDNRGDDTLTESTKLAHLPIKDREQKDVQLSSAVLNESAKPPQTADDSPPKVPKQSHALPLPPPPPPPPPSLQQQHTASEMPSPSVSCRSDLMAAIRAAGGVKGAKLKKVEEKNVGEGDDGEGKGERRNATTGDRRGEPEDLMSSLAKALEMRRRGMLGRGATSSSGGTPKPKKPSGEGGTLSVLRERIPRVSVESEEDDEEEEEWGSEWAD